MNDLQPSRNLHQILVTAGIVLAALVVLAAAVYAAAFLILAPMMQ